MKKIILLCSIFFALMSTSKAQSFDEGSSIISAGLGLGSNLYTGSETLRVPPLFVTYDYGFRDQWSLGGIIGVAGSKERWHYLNQSYQYNYSHFILAARGAYHIYSDYTWDAYAGASLGFDIVTGSYSGAVPVGYEYATRGSSLFLGLYAGGRYYFNDQIAAFAEIGYNVGFLNLGVSFKLQ
ncbi:MAG: hypothetical protein ACEPOW_04800 [Bacteroidales bacterium]